MGEEGYVALLCNCTQGRFLLPGGEGEDEGFNTLPGIPWKLPLSLRNGPLGPESIRGSGRQYYGAYIASTSRSDFSLGNTDCAIWFIT